MFFKEGESAAHLFLQCDVTRFLWGKPFGIMSESWFCMDYVLVLLLEKVGFGRDWEKEKRTL